MVGMVLCLEGCWTGVLLVVGKFSSLYSICFWDGGDPGRVVGDLVTFDKLCVLFHACHGLDKCGKFHRF